MRLVTASIAAALAAVVAPLAVAAPVHINDIQFITANQCLGLMSSKALGTTDAAAMKHFIHDQSYGRDGSVYDRADQARDDAESDANRGGTDHRARLIAERDGVCHDLLRGATSTAAADGPTRTLR
jgi:hypothetical protein